MQGSFAGHSQMAVSEAALQTSIAAWVLGRKGCAEHGRPPVVLRWGLAGPCRAVGCVGWGCWAGSWRAVSPAALAAVLPAQGSNQHGEAVPRSLQPPWMLCGSAEAGGVMRVLVARVVPSTELQLGSQLPLLACDSPAGKAGVLQDRAKKILSVTVSIAEVLGLYHLINFTAEHRCDQEMWKSWVFITKLE